MIYLTITHKQTKHIVCVQNASNLDEGLYGLINMKVINQLGTDYRTEFITSDVKLTEFNDTKLLFT